MFCEERYMTLAEMKNKIIEELYKFSAYQLPNVCESIGLEPGDGEEAFQSKRRYVLNRIQSLNKKEIIIVLRQLSEKYDIKLIPEDNYSYKISNVTKRDVKNLILDGFTIDGLFGPQEIYVGWNGLISEIDFIKRVCDTTKIKVNDGNFNSFDEEYRYHREIKKDYKKDYFFESDRLPFKNSNTQTFLNIICQIFHPEVRNEDGNWQELKDRIELLIKEDGFEFFVVDRISGREVFGARKITFLTDDEVNSEGISRIVEVIDNEYIRRRAKMLFDSLEDDSTATIGKCKELVETACKYILEELNVSSSETEDLIQLNKKVSNALGLAINEKNKKIDGAVQVLSGLISIINGLSSLRNKFGDGHGKERNYIALPKRYGLLAVGCTSTYINFLLDTYEDKLDKTK